MKKVTRFEVHEETLQQAVALLQQKLRGRVKRKGYEAYAGPHETYGLMAEEVKEVLDAVHGNDGDGFEKELLDVAVVAIFGLASALEASKG